MLNNSFNKFKELKDHLFQILDGSQCNLKEVFRRKLLILELEGHKLKERNYLKLPVFFTVSYHRLHKVLKR